MTIAKGRINVPRRIADSITPQTSIAILNDAIFAPIHIAGRIIIEADRAIVPIEIAMTEVDRIIAEVESGGTIAIVIDGISHSTDDVAIILDGPDGAEIGIGAIINSITGNIGTGITSNRQETLSVPASAGRRI